MRPAAAPPVKPMCATAGCVTSASPTSGPRPVTTLTTPFGKPASLNELRQLEHRRRRELRRLDDHRAARGERRRELPAGQRERRVPRRDDGDHALRLVARVGEDALLVARDDGALDLVGETRVVAEVVAHVADLADDLARELAVVALLDLGQARRVGDRPGRRAATAAGRARTASARARRRRRRRAAPPRPRPRRRRGCRARSTPQALPVYGFSVGRYSPACRRDASAVDVVVVPDQRFSALHAFFWQWSTADVPGKLVPFHPA